MIRRTDKIITGKFIQFLFPAFGTAIAFSLSEFVDSILVSQLLGTNALAVVNVGSPINFLASFTYILFGLGGSIVYGRALGQKDRAMAAAAGSAACILAPLLSLIFMAAGLIFRIPVTGLLLGESELYAEALPYITLQFISIPLVVIVMGMASFLPVLDHPLLATACSLIANAVNLIMDYVFIRLLGFGASGAACGTISGYAFAGLVLLILILSKKILIPFRWKGYRLRKKEVLEILKVGLPASIVQLGFALTGSYCNALAIAAGGTDGLVAYSFYMQLSSMISIFIGGVCEGAEPVYALLFGADDRNGIRMLTKKAVLILAVCSGVLIALLLFKPTWFFAIFSIESPSQQALCRDSIAAFAIYALFRNLVIQYRDILSCGNHPKYSMVVAIFDRILCVFLFSRICTGAWGVHGLWIADMFGTGTTLLMILCCNLVLWKKSGKHISPVFLFPESKKEFLVDSTIRPDAASMSELSRYTEDQCLQAGISKKTASFAGILTEEMAVYTRNHNPTLLYMDVLVSYEEGRLQVDFRSIGKPFNPMVETESDEHVNILMIKSLIKSIKYEYAMGLNTTTLLLEEK